MGTQIVPFFSTLKDWKIANAGGSQENISLNTGAPKRSQEIDFVQSAVK